MSDDLKNLFQELEKAKKESVKEEQENLNKTASSLKTTVGVIKQNEISNLFEGLEQASVEADIEIKKKLELNEKEKEKLNDFSALMEKVGSLSEKTEEENVSQITEVVTEFVEPEIIEEVVEEKKPTTIIDEIVSNLDDMGQKTEVKEQLDEIQSLRKEFEQYKRTLQNQVTKGLATSSGSGEVRLEFLDDVQRSTAKVNNKFLKYDSTAGLFVGSDVTATTNTEEVQDIVGAMFSSNTETGITATYQDGDGTIDLVVGTLNQDTTGNAATATALATARNIGGVSFDGTGNINLPGVNTSGTQDTSGNAATATALATARTIHGVSFDGTGNIDLSEVVQDTVGAMFSSNTETGITVTYQDADGTIDLVVGTLNQDTTGNAATATALESARTIHGVSFDGTGNIDLSEVIQDTVGAMFSSNTETGITATYQDGDGTIDLVVGTLNQDTTGNADTATALATARTIHGVSFDGTANIDLSEVIQDTVGAMFSSNTETNISATYQDADGTIDLVVGDTTGNAATATALETARNIGGVSFDGTGNINLPGVNTSGTQDTSGNAATATALATARAINGVDFDGTGAITVTAAAGTLSGNTLKSTVTASSLTTVGTLTTLTVDNVIINGTTIGHTDDTDLITVADGSVTVAGNVTLSGATNTVTSQNTPRWNSTAQSTNFTASAGNQYFIDTSGGAFTLTLPSTANIGDEIRVVDGVGSFDINNLTIARNGHKIQRDASNLTITTEGAAFALVYFNSTNGWLLKDR